MKILETINVVEDITLISLHDSPANIVLISEIFRRIAEAGIDVDMISQSPPNGLHSSLSFTVKDEDFGSILQIAAELRLLNSDLKISVSSGNCKISVFAESMKGAPGIASTVFKAVADSGADISMITTSECDISMLVVKADLDRAVNAVSQLTIHN